MAAKSALLVVICLVAISTSPPVAEAAISCNTVLSTLSPCLSYLKNGGSRGPSPACCDGARALNKAAATTTPDRQAACRCIKSLASAAGARPVLINILPGKCRFNIPYRYSSSLDCSKIR